MLDNRLTTYLMARLVKRLIKYKIRGNQTKIAEITAQMDDLNRWLSNAGFTYAEQHGWSR